MGATKNNIKMYREQRGLTQQDLAFKIRVGSKTIQKYEEGISTPDTNVILKLSTALDVAANELFPNLRSSTLLIDDELQQLLSTIGFEKAKWILERTKDLTDEQFIQLIDKL